MGRGKWGKQAGFTLVELVIVIVLLSLLSVYAYIRWPGNVMHLSGQAQLLASDLAYAQALSMTTGQRYRWVRRSSTTYQVQNASGVAVLMPSGSTTVTFARDTVFGTFTGLPNSLVAFDGRGAPYTDTATPGTALASTAVITLVAGSSSTTVSITPETGRVTVP